MAVSDLSSYLGYRKTGFLLATTLLCIFGPAMAVAQQRQAPQSPTAPAAPASTVRTTTGGASQQDPAAPAPEQTNAVFGDWTYRCIRAPQPNVSSICEVFTSIQAQAQGQLSVNVQIAIGPSERPGLTRIVVGVPANVLIATPIRLVRDPVSVPALSYDRCVGGWCRAVSDFDADTFQRLTMASGDGRIQYQTSAGQDFIIPVSFRGFLDAVTFLRTNLPRN